MAPIEFKLKKSYSLGFQASPQAKLEWLVDEDAGESHARTVVLTADGALIYSDDQGGHHIVSRSIECHGETCLLRSSKCMVKSTPQSRKVVADLTDRMETAKDKLKLWREYFFEGKHRKDGDLVVNEAILGSGDARDLTETDKALDGRAGEVFTQLQSDIDEFAKTCARDKKKKSK